MNYYFLNLKNYPIKLGDKDNVVILDYDKKRYTAASNIQIKDEQSIPIFSVVEKSDDSAKLSSTNLPNIILTKKITLVEDSHQLLLQIIYSTTQIRIYMLGTMR